MKPIEIGIVGGGWRTEFFMRIAHALPERFRVTGVVVRDTEKADAFESAWHAKTFRSHQELVDATSPAFVVTSVPWKPNPGIIHDLVEAGMPVLSETPPAPDLEQMRALYDFVQEKDGKVQVAEQLWLRPHHTTQLVAIEKGLLGTTSQAQVSAAHGYHGISLIRRFLGLGFESPTIMGKEFISPIVKGAGRKGPPDTEQVKDSQQVMCWMEWENKLGLLDFTGDQYFGWIRNERVLIRGERGEIVNETIYTLKDVKTPLTLKCIRHVGGVDGNLESNCLKGIQAGEEWLFRNELAPAALSDDEIAIGRCFLKMADYAAGGNDFYPLAEGCQDHYLNLICQESIKRSEAVKADPQPWAQ